MYKKCSPRAPHTFILLPPTVPNRGMGSNPDSVEKAVFQPRRPHTVRGWGLLALSFSTLGLFTRLSFFPPVAHLLRRYHLFGHRNLTFVRSQWYLACYWAGTLERGRDWRNQCDYMGHDLVAVVEIRESTLPCFRDISLTASFRFLSACISGPEKEKEEASLCFKGYILLPTRTSTTTEF